MSPVSQSWKKPSMRLSSFSSLSSVLFKAHHSKHSNGTGGKYADI